LNIPPAGIFFEKEKITNKIVKKKKFSILDFYVYFSYPIQNDKGGGSVRFIKKKNKSKSLLNPCEIIMDVLKILKYLK